MTFVFSSQSEDFYFVTDFMNPQPYAYNQTPPAGVVGGNSVSGSYHDPNVPSTVASSHSVATDVEKVAASYPTEEEILKNSCKSSVYSHPSYMQTPEYGHYSTPQPSVPPMGTPGYDPSPYMAPQYNPYGPPSGNQNMPPQNIPPQYLPPTMGPPNMPPQNMPPPNMAPPNIPPPSYGMAPPQPGPTSQYPYNPYMPPQQSPQNQLRCPTCQKLLYIPHGTELFRCPCGQVLRNPYFQKSYPPPTTSQPASTKSNSSKKDLVDAGLGIGIGLAGAAVLGAMLARK